MVLQRVAETCFLTRRRAERAAGAERPGRCLRAPSLHEDSAWQPNQWRGQPSGDGVSAAALTGPPRVALTGRAVGGASALPTAHR
jgi:hypothetical protein